MHPEPSHSQQHIMGGYFTLKLNLVFGIMVWLSWSDYVVFVSFLYVSVILDIWN